MLIPALERWMEPDFRLNTLVDGDAENLAGRCCTEVRDVEVAVRAECHTGRNGEPGGYIFDIAGAVKAYNLAVAMGLGSRQRQRARAHRGGHQGRSRRRRLW